MTTTERGERITDEASEGGLPPDIELALAEYLEGISSGSPLLDCLWGELYGAINANLWAGNITAERAERLQDEMWESWEEGKLPPSYQALLTYVSDVMDGGHLQYFLNRDLREENFFSLMPTLRELLPEGHAGNLSNAYRAYCRLELDLAKDGDIAEALDADPLISYDKYYFDHEEEIFDLLAACAESLA